MIDQLESLAGRRYVASFDMALAWLGMGDHDGTLRSLERSVEERSPRLLFLAVDPRFDPLRSNARFQALVGRVGAVNKSIRDPQRPEDFVAA